MPTFVWVDHYFKLEQTQLIYKTITNSYGVWTVAYWSLSLTDSFHPEKVTKFSLYKLSDIAS